MASRMFSRASSRLCPWLTQPGMDGHSATQTPSSSRSSVVTNFIDGILRHFSPLESAFGYTDWDLCFNRLASFPLYPKIAFTGDLWAASCSLKPGPRLNMTPRETAPFVPSKPLVQGF